jgi:hypothetical protein
MPSSEAVLFAISEYVSVGVCAYVSTNVFAHTHRRTNQSGARRPS